jgi:RNA polymerase sigma-70 factor, ECF subfamily
MADSREITALLADWRNGNQAALDKLVPLVYEELRRLASGYMRRERSEHTLQTTALVHEAYVHMVEQRNVPWQTRAHFFAVAAQVMRHILVDYARGARRAKRGSGLPRVPLEDVELFSEEHAEELIAVNSALDKLKAMDPRMSQVFEMRYFGGMSVEEAAEALQISAATVARDWRMAKAWLRREMALGAPNQDGA